MKPMLHAKSSEKKFGGSAQDYLEIHDFMDSSKACTADVRHRAILHSSFGAFIVERVFGHTITNSENKEVSVRDVAEQHILEDLGFIPSLDKWFATMQVEPWMGGPSKKTTSIPYPETTTPLNPMDIFFDRAPTYVD